MLGPRCGCAPMDDQHWVCPWFSLQHYPSSLQHAQPMSPDCPREIWPQHPRAGGACRRSRDTEQQPHIWEQTNFCWEGHELEQGAQQDTFTSQG